jgi:protein TonB
MGASAAEPVRPGAGVMDPLPEEPRASGSPSGSPSGSGGVGCRQCGKPSYPRIARDRGWEGQVLLSVNIDPQGNVTAVQVVNSSGYDVLDESAKEKAWSWKFESSDSGEQGRLISIPFRLEDS